jgi:hypothetical protein
MDGGGTGSIGSGDLVGLGDIGKKYGGVFVTRIDEGV